MTSKGYIADNAIVEDAIIEADRAIASVDFQPFGHLSFETERWWDSSEHGLEGAVGVVRVHVLPDLGGIGLSTNIESEELDFETCIQINLDREQARELTRIIEETVAGEEARS